MAWKPVAIVGLAVALAAAMIAILPASPRHTLRVAEAAGSCPITIRVHGSSSPTLPSIAAVTRPTFENTWALGTAIDIVETNSNNGIADLTAGNADIAISTRPLTSAESAGKYQWQIENSVWVSTRDTTTVSRIDNSPQVRADDWINFTKSPFGLSLIPPEYGPFNGAVWTPTIPDWDVNLDGYVDIGDLGAVASRWGQSNPCKGWIRADTRNRGNVALSSIGGVTSHWGQNGFVPPPVPGPSIWETLGGSYANASPCAGNPGDPIGTILLAPSVDAPSATQLANNRLSDIGMTTGYGHPIPGGPELTGRDNFLDNGGCVEGSITRGTNGGWERCGLSICTASRWHTRCIVHTLPSPYGYWASCAPHWEAPACMNSLTGYENHYVPEVYNGPENWPGLSGYDAARDWTYYHLVEVLGMTFVGPVFFDNGRFRPQCNGARPRTDTKVNVIQLQ